MLQSLDLPHRAHAAGLHLLISATVALLAAILVFGVWYPGIYRVLAGGQDLFVLITCVDVALGPLLTFAVFNLKKGWPHLRRDLTIIGAIQLAALVYGILTVYAARPIATVFEVDRFRVITAVQVNASELNQAEPEYQQLPRTGPWLLSTREPRDRAEKNSALAMALQSGIDRAERPVFWQPYAKAVPEVLNRARPLAVLFKQYPAAVQGIRSALQSQQLDENTAKFLPITGRGGDWIVILDTQGQLRHYVKANGFF